MINSKYSLFLLIVCLVHSSLQRSSPQDDHYIAAVVEYQVNRNVEHNRALYTQLIKEASEQNADIVIFPELTLTNNSVNYAVPFYSLLKEYPVPALHPDLYDDLLVSMSEAARNNGIYLVFNGIERMDCTNNDTGEYCPEAKEYLFNTNVVMDRNGAVIDRYRKINLFGEYSRTPALRPDLGLFSTDFGVQFGHFVCFDLMFQVPAIQVVQKHQLKDVIFTTMWFSEMPYLTAVQIQEAYAYAMDVNFLASGANNPSVGSAGSGIFSGKAGALISIMPGVPTTRLLVAKVPKVPGQVTEPVPGPIYDDPKDHDNLTLISDPSLPSHVSRLLVDGSQEFVLVDKDVSCTFRVKLNHGAGEQVPRYRAMVKDGTNIYSRRELGTVGCLLVACKDEDFKSCTYKFDPKTTKSGIEELEIHMRTYKHQHNTSLMCDNIVYFPVSFRASKFPLARSNVTYTDKSPKLKRNNHNLNHNEQNCHDSGTGNTEFKNLGLSWDQGNTHIVYESQDGVSKIGDRERITFKINKPQEDLVAFGIWGRIYTRDVDHARKVTKEDLDGFNNILDTIYGTDQNIKD